MNKGLFQKFLKAAQVDDRVSWDYDYMDPYLEVLNEIFAESKGH